jgi:osmotically-inducible protein OsmY
MSQSLTGVAIAMALTTTLAIGCSHGEERGDRRARADTSGAERRADARERRAAAEAREEADEAGATVADAEVPTAFDQSESAEDLEITRQIRAAVVSDSSLSFGARNVTIITADAVVTLRGDVSSNAERDAIDRHAHETAGVSRVDNMLVVTE